MENVKEKLDVLNKLLSKEIIKLDDVKGAIKEVVPTFHEPEELNNK